MIDLIKYDWKAQMVSQNTSIDTDCIDVLFDNQGSGTVFINDYPLLPGRALPIGGNIGEKMTAAVNISFATGAVTYALWIIRRYYTDNT